MPDGHSNSTSSAAAAHLLNRLTFGPRPGDVRRLTEGGAAEFLERQLAPEPEHERLARKLRTLPAIDYTASEFVLHHQLDKQSAASVECPLEQLRTAKLQRAAESENQLQEVLVDFWYNHFNVTAQAWQASVPEYERETIRPHVLGRFRDLLIAVARSPAMMFSLDTYISTANRVVGGKVVLGLNENYGRELLELHTVGVSAGYTQHDVTEAARCFTGWDFGGWHAPLYAFRFSREQHDSDAKKIFGLALPAGGGEDDGQALLDYLAVHPATARFISWRLVQRFVADDPPPSLVERCAATFSATGGEIRSVMRTLIESDEFRTASPKLKSPLEFAVSAIRAADGEIVEGKPLADALGRMGMPLYDCKPPTGYSNRGSDWLNVSGQLHRFNFAVALSTGTFRGVTVASSKSSPAAVAQQFADNILGAPLSASTVAALARASSKGNVAAQTKALALLIASPEFQVR
ncbi:MAG: hypothetical protein JWO97_396 [Acidobacteria bacterium]|nr:hypothetical protein [Acidobacteriota bacterium]